MVDDLRYAAHVIGGIEDLLLLDPRWHHAFENDVVIGYEHSHAMRHVFSAPNERRVDRRAYIGWNELIWLHLDVIGHAVNALQAAYGRDCILTLTQCVGISLECHVAVMNGARNPRVIN